MRFCEPSFRMRERNIKQMNFEFEFAYVLVLSFHNIFLYPLFFSFFFCEIINEHI